MASISYTGVRCSTITMTIICSSANHKSSIMKLFLVLLFVGYASATVFEALERESRATLNAFINGIQRGMPLHVALGVEDSYDLQKMEADIKEELKQHIIEAFNKALKKIEDAVKANKTVNIEAFKKLKELKKKLISLDVDEKEIELGLDVLKKMVDDQLKTILEKMGLLDKRRSVENELFESVLGDLSMRDIFIKLKNMAAFKVSQAAEGNPETIKEYLENIEKDAENKLARFKEWLDSLFHRGLEEAKEGLQNIKELVKEITADGKTLTKKGIAEILDYLREYED